jgi:RNA polymerase sigma-70 factor, ECF subfamily
VSQSRDDLYQQATSTYGDALDRLVRAYELDSEKRRDLLQEIHLALWRSFEKFEGRCSLRTWVYRLAHNVATSHVIRQHRANSRLVSLEEIDTIAQQSDAHAADRWILNGFCN